MAKMSRSRESRSNNTRKNKVEGIGSSVPKPKWEDSRQQQAKAIHIQPKNFNQDLLLRSLRENTITIGSGSAGTGKSLVSCYSAANMLLSGEVRKIVITRPYVAVSGRTTGFKPNTDLEKLRGFVLPMIGYLSDVLGKNMVEQQLLLSDKIELAPLESIRGRSFSDSFIIVDEAQNTTIGEIQAITTRLGEGSRMAILGDNSQSDMQVRDNGLSWFENLVVKHRISDIGVVHFTKDDIVRSGMVKELIIAFEKEGGYLK